MSNLLAIVLAAGQGTRMRSKLPKVLHKVLGKPMLQHVLDACSGAGIEKNVVVLGHKAEVVEQKLDQNVQVVYQREQLGTGHAVMQAKGILDGFMGNVLVLCGDTPLLTKETLIQLINHQQEKGAKATILTAQLDNPTGYGRIIRSSAGNVLKIVEEKDADELEKKVAEINTGAYCFDAKLLNSLLGQLTTANAQNEYYLTDVIKLLVQQNELVEGLVIKDPEEASGINNRMQLARAEQVMRQRKLEELMAEGVTIIDPVTTYVEAQVSVGMDTVIYPMTFLEGQTVIGENCVIGPGTRIIDAKLANNIIVNNSNVLESEIADNCNIGPYAYIRPGTILLEDVKVGDFVEIKKSIIGKGSKIPHLSYVGDAEVGTAVNIGAGTITCNYDGFNKYKTIIEDGAFVGSNTNLVAPVTIGAGAITGAGSTITHDVPENSLAVERAKQRNIEGWARKFRIKK